MTRAQWFRSLLIGSCVFLVLFCLGVLGGMMSVVYTQGGIEELQPADAILVLGTGHVQGKPSQVFQARLDHAYALYNQRLAPTIIVTGGIGKESSVSDSRVGMEYLVRHGINSNNIFIEEKSKTTKQNLALAREIMNEHGIDSVLLVSHDFHMIRAKRMARDLGITIFLAPVRTKSEFQHLQYSVRETIMTLLYKFFSI